MNAASAAPSILVIDDEPQIHRFLKPALEAGGYAVCQAYTAADGLRLVAERAPAAILLDLGLPDFDGQEVIRRTRAFSHAPIIIVSARDVEAEKIMALDNGADDFVDKPFSIGELLARLRNCLRHATIQEKSIEEWNNKDITVNLTHKRVFVKDIEIYFTPREYDLLSVLIRHAGVVLTHRQLLVAVWGSGHAEDVQYLRVYIGIIRQKLGPTGASIILTAARVGYRIAEET